MELFRFRARPKNVGNREVEALMRELQELRTMVESQKKDGVQGPLAGYQQSPASSFVKDHSSKKDN